jgi:hypothetical protein
MAPEENAWPTTCLQAASSSQRRKYKSDKENPPTFPTIAGPSLSLYKLHKKLSATIWLGIPDRTLALGGATRITIHRLMLNYGHYVMKSRTRFFFWKRKEYDARSNPFRITYNTY